MKLFFQILSKLPISWLRALAKFIASILNNSYFLEKRKGMRWSVHVNSYIAFPEMNDEERKAFSKQALRNECIAYFEFVKSWGSKPEYSIGQIRDVHNQDLIKQAMQNPNGVMAIIPHLGTWEMMSAWLTQFSSTTIMYKPFKDKGVDDFVLSGRQRLDTTLVPTDVSGIKDILKELRSGGFTIMLPDHKPKGNTGGVYVPFFGVDTLTATIVGKLASKTQCALLGMSCIRRDDGDGFDVYCYELNDDDLWAKDAKVATAALNQAMENMIRKHPEHYHWRYKRFRESKLAGQAEIIDPYRWTEEQVIESFVTERQQ